MFLQIIKIHYLKCHRQKRPCIEQLLTNEYQRIWWQEKASWDRRMQSKAPSKKLLHRMVKRNKDHN